MSRDREHQRGEAAEAQMDTFIAHRAKGSTFAQDRAREWRESKERYLAENAEAETHRWITHLNKLAGVHEQLAHENRARAERLSASLPGRGEGA